MAGHSQIVPSKNALRALRKLALGGSTVVGAVGSVSGLACVSYDIWQRIRLAESIVETKRVLHSQSISNPNRKAHMTVIFDMYEKGQGKEGDESWQDFSRRARRHSAQAKCNNNGELVDTITKKGAVHCDAVSNRSTNSESSKKMLHNSTSRPIIDPMPPADPRERSRLVLKETAPPREARNTLTARRIIEATRKPHKVDLHTVYGRPQGSRNISPVQKIITATQLQHKLTSHVVFGRPKRKKDEALPKLASCVQQWLIPAGGKRQLASPVTSSKIPNAAGKLGWGYESVRRYSAFAVKLQDDLEYPAMRPSTADFPYDDAFFPNGNKRPDTADHGRDYDLLPLMPAPKTKLEAVLKTRESQEPIHPQLENLNQDAQGKIPDVESELTILMDSFVRKPKVSREMHDISAFSAPCADLVPAVESKRIHEPSAVLQRLSAVIICIKNREGAIAARNFTKSAFNLYAQRGRPEDYRAIDRLHLKFCRELPLSTSTQPMRELIHYLLNTGLADDLRRAGRLLFHGDLDNRPSDDSATLVTTYRYERLAKSYIAWLCSTCVSNFSIVHEFRKVLEVAYQDGTSPCEALFSTILQRFLERGDLKYLRNMFDEMKAAHGIEPTSITLTPLLLSYARANDWAQIVTEFETMHKNGVSRKEPMSYARMFDEVFQHYALSESIEKTHDFLMNAICYWGVVPITKMSATAVQAYIRHRRYDLIKEWIQAVKYLFPHVENTGNRFAATLAETWNEIGASCEEIEEACACIIRGRDSIPAGRFRAVVQEALAGSLARKLHATNPDGGPSDNHSSQANDPNDLSAQLNSAFTIILKDAGESRVVKQSSVADILAQSRAALRVRELLGEKIRISAPDVELAPRLDRPSRKQTDRQTTTTKDLSTPFPEALRREQLPDLPTIISLISAYYSERSKLDEPVNHEILRITCRQLSLTRRHHDTLRIISHIYNGPALQGSNGVMFDLDIIQPWMEAAYHLKSPVACKQVLHAILEKGSAIRLTQQFMLLVRMASLKAFGTRFGRGTRTSEKKAAELNYLQNRLKDRFYTQRKHGQLKKGRDYDALSTFGNANLEDLPHRSRRDNDRFGI